MFPEQENLPPENNDSQDNTPEPENGDELVPRRKKVRIKVRKKIRIKKKPSAKKMVRKIAERVFWTVIIVGFIASLIIMVVQLDVRDEKYKQIKRKASTTKSR